MSYCTNKAIADVEANLPNGSLTDSAISNWTYLNSIDLDDFFTETRPGYIIRVCKLNRYDCKNLWQFEKSLMGNCLAFDPNPLIVKGRMKKIR